MRIRILGKFWQLRFVSALGGDKRGDCDAPTVKGKEIRILSTLKGEERLEILLHEMLHAADWNQDEEWVNDTARDMAKAVTKLGFVEGRTDG